jgi:hypothetical protein
LLGSDDFEIIIVDRGRLASSDDTPNVDINETNSTDEPIKIFDKIKTGG